MDARMMNKQNKAPVTFQGKLLLSGRYINSKGVFEDIVTGRRTARDYGQYAIAGTIKQSEGDVHGQKK